MPPVYSALGTRSGESSEPVTRTATNQSTPDSQDVNPKNEDSEGD